MAKDDNGLTALKSGLSVFSRLFDHRAILQGEALYFIDEFQNKRKGSEINKLNQAREMLESQCQNMPNSLEKTDSFLTQLDGKVLKLTDLCDLILPDKIDVESSSVTPYSRPPSPGIDSDWDSFMSSIDKEEKLIGELFENEIEQFKIYLDRQSDSR